MTIKAGKTEGGDALLYGTPDNPNQGSRPIGWNLLEPKNIPALVEVSSEGSPLQLVTPLGRRIGGTVGARQSNPGTVFSKVGRQVLADYELTAGATGAIDATVTRDGSPTLRMTRATAGTSTVRILHAKTPVLDRNGRVGVWVYVPDYTRLTSFIPKIALADDTFGTGYFQTYSFGDADKQYNGWHFVSFSGADWTGTWGTPNWATQPVFQIWFDVVTSAANTTVYFDQWQIGWTGVPQIMITDDDGYESWFTRGLPVLNAYGLKSAASVIGSLIGTNATWATEQMLADAYDQGHEMVPHGAQALNLLASEAARESDILANRSYLTSRGYTKGADFYVYPNGVYQLSAGNQEIINILKRNGFKAARGTTSPRYTKPAVGYADNRWLLPIIGMDTATSAATIKQRIDLGVANGDLMILMLHDIVPSGGSGIDVTVDKLDEVCKHIAELIGQGKLLNVTPSQIYN